MHVSILDPWLKMLAAKEKAKKKRKKEKKEEMAEEDLTEKASDQPRKSFVYKCITVLYVRFSAD